MKSRIFSRVLSVLFVAAGAPAIGSWAASVAGAGPSFGAAVAVAAAAFGLKPVRAVCEWVSRKLMKPEPDAFTIIQALAAEVAKLDPRPESLPTLAAAVGRATGARSVDVSAGRASAKWTAPAGDEATAESESASVIQGHQPVGTLTAALDRSADLGRISLAGAASQIAPFLRNLVLVSELEAHVRSLEEQAAALREASRRIVSVSDSERRRLERNLHDGAQQQLTALIFRIGLARQFPGADPERLRAAGAELSALTQDVVDTLADLGEGAHPRVLRDRGLTQALLSQVAHLPTAVEASVEQVDRHDPEIEAAVYFSCVEALQNALRHSAATTIRLELSETDTEIRFAVADDGCGFDRESQPRGVGLDNLASRLAGVGGKVEILSRRGQGTTVVGRAPVGMSAVAVA